MSNFNITRKKKKS